MEPIMKEYCELVGFLGKVLGQDYEIILHDLSNMDHSVIAVANGHVSGRRIGSPMNENGLRLIRSGAWKDNYDYTNSQKLVDSLTEQLGIASLPDQAESEKYFKSDTEKFPDNMEEVVYGICNQVLSEATVPVDRLSQDEKIAIVEKLDGKGVFLFKGAVALVAGRLQTSEATIYRYLSKINRAGGKNGLQ